MMNELHDSGERTVYASGAVRDTGIHKGRCDLLPLHFIAYLLRGDQFLMAMDDFLESKEPDDLKVAFQMFVVKHYDGDIYTAILELSKQFEDGLQKYSASQWSRGMPIHRFIDSSLRHYFQYLRGDKDEPHKRACLWNILCAWYTLEIGRAHV